MPTSQISTSLAGVDAAVVIKSLHNHDLMIKTLNPALISYAFESGDKNSSAVYTVTDKKPIGQTTFKLTITNLSDGVDTLVNANPPVGTLAIKSKWRVMDGKLSEEIEIDGNFMIKKVAKGNVEKTHPGQHMKLIEAARS
ncbi:hypothetical protein yc1106_03544 [Curvularia clavata]|uniref:DUF7053 domain-containing protein n=1 Tax=Curvularia clavata TaxID=95742 RepID=A0A9Q9DRP7_CURCL|nr:hypothetical protein yc1106_03544 [Curvularia clavata]